MGNKENISVYYDDNEVGCCEYVKYFEKYDRVTCKKISEYSEKVLAFEPEKIVGFILAGTDKKLSNRISSFLSQIIMDKKTKCFLIITEGSRELGTLKQAVTELERRGYRVVQCCSPYLLEKREIDIEKAIKDILKYIDINDSNVRVSELGECYKKGIKKSRNLRKRVRQEMKEYFAYYKKKKQVIKE